MGLFLRLPFFLSFPLLSLPYPHQGRVRGVGSQSSGHRAGGRAREQRREAEVRRRRRRNSTDDLRRRRCHHHPRRARGGEDGGARSGGHGRDDDAEHAVWSWGESWWEREERVRARVREKKTKEESIEIDRRSLSLFVFFACFFAVLHGSALSAKRQGAAAKMQQCRLRRGRVMIGRTSCGGRS